MDAEAADAHLDKTMRALTLVLQQQRPNSLQDAATFSRVLCSSQRLAQHLLAAATDRVTFTWSLAHAETLDDPWNVMQWLERHVLLRTLKQVQVLPHATSRALHHPPLSAAAVRKLQWSFNLISRISCSLGSAAAYMQPTCRLPLVERWCCTDLPPASLSQLPGGHLTKLMLLAQDPDHATTCELKRLTSLKELHLPHCRPGALSLRLLPALTCLTGLLLANPDPSLLSSIPPSVQSLVLSYKDCCSLLPLQHLSQLQTLYLTELSDINEAAVLPSRAALPPSLRFLSASSVKDVQPLACLTALQHLQLRGFTNMPRVRTLKGWAAPASLTVLELVMRWNEDADDEGCTLNELAEVHRVMQESKLPVKMPSLWLEVPTIFHPATDAGFAALAALTSLTQLKLSAQPRIRSAAILLAAAAAGGNGVGTFTGSVQQLADALRPLTNLRALHLSKLALVSSSSLPASEHDWDPVVDVIAGLPCLRELSFDRLPLGHAVVGLRAAQQLTSLHLLNSKVKHSSASVMVQDMRCCTSLQRIDFDFTDIEKDSPETLTLARQVRERMPRLYHMQLCGICSYHPPDDAADAEGDAQGVESERASSSLMRPTWTCGTRIATGSEVRPSKLVR